MLGGGAGLAPLLDDNIDDDMLMSFSILEGPKANDNFRGWRKIELLVDSGAADSVLPEGMLQDFKLHLGDAFKKGVSYVTACGERLPNLGESKIPFVTAERMRCEMTFQIADVSKPLLAVSSLTKNGLDVTFNDDGGYILNRANNKRIRFKRRGRL